METAEGRAGGAGAVRLGENVAGAFPAGASLASEEGRPREEMGETALGARCYRRLVPPSEPAPVVTVREGMGRITRMNFGSVIDRGRQMMARGEQRPMFCEAFRHRRCLILAHGFYDSEDMGKKAGMQPWHLHLKGDGLMAFAGLWEKPA